MRRIAGALLAAVVLALSGASAAECADAAEPEIELDAPPALLPGYVPEGSPPRFVLLEDGQVFVGGTSHVAAGRLGRDEMKAIEKQVSEVRKLPGLGSAVTLGPGRVQHRLLLRKGRPLEIVATGDPAQTPPALRPLGALIDRLAAFHHPSLRPYEPAAFALRVVEGALPGGCRSWAFDVPLAQALAGPQTVPGPAAHGWPTGATPASVCDGNKTYVVTLRPLLPDEKP
jgi:hypothetical protein